MLNWHDLFVALALVMVIEGILPFVSPASMRKYMEMMSQMPNEKLRMAGFFSMLAGVALLFLVNA
jgi:uncharacterized protein YjeT (DUF2065 family)